MNRYYFIHIFLLLVSCGENQSILESTTKPGKKSWKINTMKEDSISDQSGYSHKISFLLPDLDFLKAELT
ncbi:hypothetical protein [uncultured Draconibacterium sp.]|uniref:hypothetical protein n=1 Tax=uncultured Draconibacterium sp. TaxID=1573823 RepID=UPI0032172B84